MGCAAPEEIEVEETDCKDICFLYHGDMTAGQACSYYAGGGFYSNCAQGLICNGTKCVNPCKVDDPFDQNPEETLGNGETCRGSDGLILGECAEGLYCDSGYTDTCRPLPLEGQECLLGYCAEGLWCENAGTGPTCVPQLGLGRECYNDQTCRSGYCQNGLCTAVPGVGQPCTDRCKEDLICMDTLVCSEGPGLGEQCYNYQCAPGLVCENNFCRKAPPAICGDIYS
jgi:hypothetical protein